MSDKIIRCVGVKKYFPAQGFWKTKAWVRAVDGLTFEINKGESFGVAGESGCGKSTLANCLLRLTGLTEGEIYFAGQLLGSKRKELRVFRRKTGLVYQDPLSSLDPRMTIADIVGEPLRIQKLLHGVDRDEKVLEVMEKVGLTSDHMFRYPHEFSGGQKQRIAIARAIVTNPDFVVLDEPTSALDVSVQGQILNLLSELRMKLGLSYMFISHNLAVIEHMCDRIAILYLGKIMESAPTDKLFKTPLHPYTQALFSAIPEVNIRGVTERIILKGDLPSPLKPPPGCRFHPRCWRAFSKCNEVEPLLTENEPKHYVACHLYST